MFQVGFAKIVAEAFRDCDTPLLIERPQIGPGESHCFTTFPHASPRRPKCTNRAGSRKDGLSANGGLPGPVASKVLGGLRIGDFRKIFPAPFRRPVLPPQTACQPGPVDTRPRWLLQGWIS